MTKLYEDILRQPRQLAEVLARVSSDSTGALDQAARLVAGCRSIYVVGMGASWHAGMAVASFFHARRRDALLFDASEFLLLTDVPENAAVILLSRSGKSKEIVDLLPKLRACNAKIVSITNDNESPLAQGSDIVLDLHTQFDNAVSVTMYSAIAMVGCLLALAVCGESLDKVVPLLQDALGRAGHLIPAWHEGIEASDWLAVDAPCYFLARGNSVASCNEARLLWEEAAKSGATALTTGGFRHGPQEIVREGLRIGLWLDKQMMRTQDIELVRDLRQLGAKVLLIGQETSGLAADLVVDLPAVPAEWQFLVDIIPAQIAAECTARRAGRDCDSFRICSYIVEDEGGLSLHAAAGTAPAEATQ